jgi:nicotinamide-nucleotide amidase
MRKITWSIIMHYNKAHLSDIKDSLIEKKLTLAIAESVTGGHIQAAFSGADKASGFFQGGITVYNLGQKVRHLNVDPIKAESVNCVSKDVTISMAKGLSKLFLADINIAITGYAAPLPEKNIFDIFAWMVIMKQEKMIIAERIASKKKDPVDVQIDYTNQVIKKLLMILG